MKKSFDELKRSPYDDTFTPSEEYLNSMPDLQNGEFTGEIIDFVGIHDFRLPLRVKEKGGGTQEVEAKITGTVSLEADKRGINMSRIIRTFYKSKDDVFSISKLEKVLRDYKKDLDSFDAHILLNFNYRIWQDALRSVDSSNKPEGGWQYYNVTFDVNLDKDDKFTKIMWLDFIYSSACPCSTELAFHAAEKRGVYAIPHSQRSIMRIGCVYDGDQIWLEDLVEDCRKSLLTETLVFCKRADEQAFGEKNAAQPKFVEDAIRIMKQRLNTYPNIKDYKLICSHQESLHSHNAVAVTTKGVENSIFNHHVTLGEWNSLRV